MSSRILDFSILIATAIVAIMDSAFRHALQPRRFVAIKDTTEFGILIATAVCGCERQTDYGIPYSHSGLWL